MTALLRSTLDKLGCATSAGGFARLYHGDMADMLAALPTGSVHIAALDPPYFLSNGGTTVQSGERVSVDKGQWDVSLGVARDHKTHKTYLAQLRRVLKAEGAAWISGTHHCLYSIGFALQLGGWDILNHVTWEKPNPPPNVGCRCFTHSTEGVIWARPNHANPMLHTFNYDEAKALNEGKQLKDVWRGMAPGAAEKEHGKHPTQKPLWLYERIVELTTQPGDIVLDPFMGSGTTGVAAARLGRYFIGAERDDAHFALAMRRLGEVQPEVCGKEA